MVNATQMKALVSSHASGDDDRFYSVALQIAAGAARSGQTRFAKDLNDLVYEGKSNMHKQAKQSLHLDSQPKGDAAGLLRAERSEFRRSDLLVGAAVGERIARILNEYRQSELLRERGFAPEQSVLLVGPPGTGKTLTAKVLAGELDLPLFTVRLENLITKYMGETSSKLRLVFDAIRQTPGVYLFDEVDALATERSRSDDVGEIRRILSSLLQFLEWDVSSSLIVATTNHPALLDRAVFRRFDTVIEYQLPTPGVARNVMQAAFRHLDISGMRWGEADVAAVGLSHAELVMACVWAGKKAVLSDMDKVSTGELVKALTDRRNMGREE